MQCSPSSLPRRPRAIRSSLPAAARRRKSTSVRSVRGSAGWRRRGRLQGAMEAMALGARCVSPLWLMCIGRFRGEVVVSMCGWQGALTCGGECGCSGESALGAVEEATAEAAKHGERSSEHLAALVAEASGMMEQARAVQAERAKAAAEEAVVAAAAEAAAVAAAAAERLQAEEEVAALTLRLQEAQQRLGKVVPQAASAPPANPDAEETQCVVCMDAPKDRIVLPCMHLCACGPCAQRLLELDASCPVCRGPVERMAQVFS
jgi:hypothetical protein